MSVRDLLRDALDNLGDDDFKDFKWCLSGEVLEGCKPIPSHYLEKAERRDTVSELIKRYGDSAVTITVKAMRKRSLIATAEDLENAYAELTGAAAAAAPPAPPAAAAGPPAAAAAPAPSAIKADNGSVVFAPTISGPTGTLNINITKS